MQKVEVLVEREGNASEIRDPLLKWCGSSSGFKGFEEKWSKGR